MKRQFLSGCASLLLTLACLSGSAPAQVTGPIGGQSSPSTSTQGLSEGELESALRARDPGLKVRQSELKDGTQTVWYEFNLSVGNTIHRVVIRFVPARKLLLVWVPLTRPMDAKTVPAVQAKLNQLQLPPGSCQFDWLEHANGGYTLLATLEINQPATVAAFQARLDGLFRDIQQAHSVWSVLR